MDVELKQPQNNTIGRIWKVDDAVCVNGWILIPECTFHNQVLYTTDDINYLDLRDSDIHWFTREADVWEENYGS